MTRGGKFGAEVKLGWVYNVLIINVLQIAMRLTPALKRGLSAESVHMYLKINNLHQRGVLDLQRRNGRGLSGADRPLR